MRLRTKLKTRIKKLEAAVEKGQRYCPYCRFMLRHTLPNPNKPKVQPNEIIKARCELCNSEYLVSLESVPQSEREMFSLKFLFTLEDQYTNPKAHALALWWGFTPKRKKGERYLTKDKTKKDPNVRMLEELRDRVQKSYERKHEKLKAKYGHNPFPEHFQLIKSIRMRKGRDKNTGVFVPDLSELEGEETDCLTRAELEKIICGEALPETVSAIEDIRRRISEAIEAAVQEKGRREDKYRH